MERGKESEQLDTEDNRHKQRHWGEASVVVVVVVVVVVTVQQIQYILIIYSFINQQLLTGSGFIPRTLESNYTLYQHLIIFIVTFFLILAHSETHFTLSVFNLFIFSSFFVVPDSK